MTNDAKAAAPAGARAEQLQFLRFLAFLNIFICHGEYWNFANYPASHCAFAAVSFFIMLSGLVAGYSQYGREVPPSVGNIARDMKKKLKKLYPLYFLMILMSAVFSPISRYIASGQWEALGERMTTLLQELLLLQAWPGGEGSLWFMSAIVFLYLLTIPFLWLVRKARAHPLRYLIWGGGFVILLGTTVVYCRLTQHLDMFCWQYMFPPARIGEFLGGILLGYAIRDFLTQPVLDKLPRWLFTLGEMAVLVFWVYSLKRPGNYWMNHTVSWLVPNTLVLAVFSFGRGGVSSLFRCRPLVFLGNISFECYLVHQTVIQRYILLNPESAQTVPAQVFSFCACLLLSVYAASLLHKSGSRRG